MAEALTHQPLSRRATVGEVLENGGRFKRHVATIGGERFQSPVTRHGFRPLTAGLDTDMSFRTAAFRYAAIATGLLALGAVGNATVGATPAY